MSNNESTQITPIQGYDVNRIVFSEPISGAIPDSKPKIEFKRINISTQNEDGSRGELILPTTRLFSFGVSENMSQETGKVNGWTFPLCLWNRDGPSEEEKAWTDLFDKIVDKCIDHLVDVKDEIDMFELTKSDLTKSKGGLNPLYWKKEKHTNEQGKTVMRVVPGSGPTLYTKLIFSKKNDKFLSQFFDINDEPINALDLMGKYCYTNAAIKIESIFIGSRISLQVKLYEAVVEPTSSGMRRLLARPKAQSKVLEHNKNMNSNPFNQDYNNDNDNNDETGSLIGSDNEEQEQVESPPKVVKKRIVKKVVKKAP
jgi:hypothetical protein